MKTYDTIIIGGGITGVSLAFWHNKIFPNKKILLLEEREALASAATGRNGGFLTCGSIQFFGKLVHERGLESALEIWRFCEENRRLIQENVLQGTLSFEYDRNGAYTLLTEKASFEKALQTALLMKSCGLDVDQVSSKDIEQQLKLKGFQGGIYYSGDGSIRSKDLVAHIANHLNAEILCQQKVLSFESSANHVEVKTNQNIFHAKQVILALNPFTQRLLPELKEEVWPIRAQICETSPVPMFLRGNIYSSDELVYFRQMRSGAILLGGKRLIDNEIEHTDVEDLNTKIQDALTDYLHKHISKDFVITRRWAGIMGFCKDDIPFVGESAEHKNVFYLAGYSGHGMGMAFKSAKCLTEWLSGQNTLGFLDKSSPKRYRQPSSLKE